MPKERNPFVTVFKTEWAYLGKRKKTFVIYAFLFTLAGIISLMTPLVIGAIFNKVQTEISSPQELATILWLIVLLLAITIGFWVFHGIARVLEQLTGFYVQRSYVNTKIEQVLELPIKWHKDHHSGDTIDKINRGSTTLAEFSRNTTFEIFYALINIVGSILILFFFDIRAAIVAMVFSTGTIYVIYKLDQRLNEQYKQINTLGNKASAAIFDYVSNIITVITLRLKKTVKKEIDARLMAAYPIEKKTVILNEVKWGFASIAISLMTVLVLAWRAYSDYTTTGVIMAGTLYILYGYLDQVGRTFHRFASLYGRIVRHSSRIVNAYPIEDAFESLTAREHASLPKQWNNIELRNISFTHNEDKSRMHINNISFSFMRGEKIALIGASGSGKSTLLALLRGLDKPESGAIHIDGQEMPAGLEAIKQQVTLIPQEPELFNNSIRYNVTMDLPTKETELKKALALAQFTEVAKRLPKGTDTNVLEKGVSLSGGEKQRLALARGLLAAKESDILLMDEPTSSVDTINESKIYDNILREYKEKTIISALHRLHLLRYFDTIYIFENGKIVEHGSFNEIKKTTRFQRLWEKYHSS